MAVPSSVRFVRRPLAVRIAVGAALLLAAYACASWYLWAKQRELIFLPTRELSRTPADVGLGYEDVWVPVSRDPEAKLHGWWLPSPDPSAPVVLYLHGNDLNIGGNVDHVARLQRVGFTVAAIDYRGYGSSGGDFPSEASVYEDAEAAWDYVVAQRHVDPSRMMIYGHSLGGAVALELALRRPSAAGVIVESAFTSLPDLASTVYWIFPTDWLLNQRFDALAKVRMLKTPVLFIHGTADREVPYAMSERLYEAAPQPKRLVLVRGGGHENSGAVDEAFYARAVHEFTRDSERKR
jgi:dipeptidyl aminopeptidase/acylaminoacyl peptidase